MSTIKTDDFATKRQKAIAEKKEVKASLPSRLLSFIHGLDSEFPLSGGETNKELEKNLHFIEQESASFAKDTDNNFPLSGA